MPLDSNSFGKGRDSYANRSITAILGHLPADRPKQFLKDVELEHGRFIFEEMACCEMSQPGANDRMAKSLAEHTGPNLTEIAKRAYPGWIDAWLAEPTKYRPNTTMPKLFNDDERGCAERFAVTKYLVSLSGRPLEPYKPPFRASDDIRKSMERGRVLYSVAGCATCHQESKLVARNEEDEREPLKPEDYFYSLGTAGPAAKYALGALGSKLRPETLAAYLQDPLKTNPAGRMPHMVLNQQEATDIARYLCRVTDDSLVADSPTAPKTKPLDLAKLVFDELGANGDGRVDALRKVVGREAMDRTRPNADRNQRVRELPHH